MLFSSQIVYLPIEMNNKIEKLADVKKMVKRINEFGRNGPCTHLCEPDCKLCAIDAMTDVLLHLISDHEKMRDSLKELRESGCNTEKCECCPVVEENLQETLLQLHYNE